MPTISHLLKLLCSISVAAAHMSAGPGQHAPVGAGRPPQGRPPHPHDSPAPPGHAFLPPGPFDSRSPCPGLNALANHAYLPRSGRDLSYEDISLAASAAFNFAPDVFLLAFLAANETFSLSTTGSSLTINLRDLARHKTIEQDGSQTRNDIYFGDNLHFDATVFAPVAADLGLDDAEGFVTVETAARARAKRFALAQSVNPDFTPGDGPTMASVGTTALYLATNWAFEAEAAPKAWVRSFLGEDRIAYEDGYAAPDVKSLKWLTDLVFAVGNATV